MAGRAKIAIIGAGLCGLVLARRLSGRAHVRVFEKSRGLGGRMSNRRAAPFAFDHGAQYFSAKGDDFAAFLAPFIAEGTVARWSPRLAQLPGAEPEITRWSQPRYVAVPGMTALAKALAAGLEIDGGRQIAEIARTGSGWTLIDGEAGREEGFDWVISTAPAEQTARLLPQDFADRSALAVARQQGCYALMLGFEQDPGLDWDAAQVTEPPLGWIALNHSKPGRDTGCSVLVQSTNDWAEAHLERDQDAVHQDLLAAFIDLTGVDGRAATYASLHRWRYASVATPAGAPFLIDAAQGLAAGGDWCGAGKVEAAFDSAQALGTRLLATLEQR
ncbi:NAD(P)-binding protein [uncultured Roseobacter sp.]|uniref:NAD(P)/FAD-dependent oxidoreductase n=1 Tax=uncultured Roseobacter sp. TaxID=114847 RepID=UPI002612039B|nr:NAD(P)-binding protein [uncultured Roseobacter sp.]